MADRLGMRWKTAKAAIGELEGAKLIKRDKDSARPRYTIQRKGQDLWLPNSLIDGVVTGPAPIARLRQTQDVLAVRLLTELYGSHNLCDDGGISPTIIFRSYEREPLGQYGQYRVWRFFGGTDNAYPMTEVLRPHFQTKEPDSESWPFWPRLRILQSLGLLEWVPYLFEGPDGEPIHALAWNSGISEETELYEACTGAVTRCLTEWQDGQLEDRGGFVVPVPRHIGQVTLIGIARLRYRPRTRLTGAWWANHVERCREFTAFYDAIAPVIPAAAEAVC